MTSTALLTVIVPVYNEERTIAELLRRVRAVDLPKEILIVDDGSTDGTAALLAGVADVTVLRHPRNRGKGAAITTALAHARGIACIVQDADLEYDPDDIPALYDRYLRGDVDAVYGSRVLMGGQRHSSIFFYWGGRLVSLVASLLYGAKLTDEPTGYKLVGTSLLLSLDLRAQGFDFCPELTGRILRRGGRIAEVPIRYDPRGWDEGKKITARDGLRAMWVLLRERVRSPRSADVPEMRDGDDAVQVRDDAPQQQREEDARRWPPRTVVPARADGDERDREGLRIVEVPVAELREAGRGERDIRSESEQARERER